jgi:hypothetical protein
MLEKTSGGSVRLAAYGAKSFRSFVPLFGRYKTPHLMPQGWSGGSATMLPEPPAKRLVIG